MPLAIVLAAAWIDTLAVDEIAAEIEKSLDTRASTVRFPTSENASLNQTDTTAPQDTHWFGGKECKQMCLPNGRAG